ncbi:hypothetical protein NXS19_008529 [Fusarium pseudograminearum]|nr:hypothetical protein NXS19_008529 [Fusarium pseudograminearum]
MPIRLRESHLKKPLIMSIRTGTKYVGSTPISSSHHRKTIDFITRKVTAEFTIASEHLQNGFGEVLQTLWTECHRRMRNHSNWSKSQMTKFRDV